MLFLQIATFASLPIDVQAPPPDEAGAKLSTCILPCKVCPEGGIIASVAFKNAGCWN